MRLDGSCRYSGKGIMDKWNWCLCPVALKWAFAVLLAISRLRSVIYIKLE